MRPQILIDLSSGVSHKVYRIICAYFHINVLEKPINIGFSIVDEIWTGMKRFIYGAFGGCIECAKRWNTILVRLSALGWPHWCLSPWTKCEQFLGAKRLFENGLTGIFVSSIIRKNENILIIVIAEILSLFEKQVAYELLLCNAEMCDIISK